MRTVNRALRLGVVAGAFGVASLALSACDASPYAASVNGHVITVSALNHQLASWASNKAFASGFDSSNTKANGGNGDSIVGAGGPGTYSSTYASEILTEIVAVTAIGQHLQASGISTTQDQIVTARAVNEYIRSQYWTQFSPDVREFLVEQLADEGALVTPVPSGTSLQQQYGDIQPYLFSSLCVNQASASTSGQARQIISSGSISGTQICYDQASLEAQSQAYQAAVLKLAKPGDISAPVPTSYGFVVLKLATRATPGLSGGVIQVLSAATNTPSKISQIVNGAHVKVNPTYGTWSNGQITPPKPPLSS